MKREIKFRGKRLDNNEWVYGYYVAIAGTHKICAFSTESSSGAIWHDVDPDTVGQYTGLKDYNGKDICEDDILGISALNLPERAIVTYHNGAFALVESAGWLLDPIYGYDTDAFDIIGNIHDK